MVYFVEHRGEEAIILHAFEDFLQFSCFPCLRLSILLLDVHFCSNYLLHMIFWGMN